MTDSRIFVFSVLFVAFQSNSVFGLSCTKCSSMDGWDDCRSQGQSVQCTVAEVNEIHNQLKFLNPTLEVVEDPATAVNYSFKCFSIEIAKSDDDTQRGVASGCTFAKQEFCKGWLTNLGIRVVECSTCETGDTCPATATPSPTEAASTSTLAPTTSSASSSSSTTSVTNSVTTAKPDNSGSIVHRGFVFGIMMVIVATQFM